MEKNPMINVIDTDFSKGRLLNERTISLEDTSRFHGHLCDGLVVGFMSLREALHKLYPNKIVDRTNTRIISKPSPCYTDIAIYLTGARYQFNTFFVSNDISYNYIVQRIDNGQAYGVNIKPGIKPAIIDKMGSIAVAQELPPCEIDKLRKMEDDFSNKILAMDPAEAFDIKKLSGFIWNPELRSDFIKTDVINKALPACLH